jgi:hypothetical protein
MQVPPRHEWPHRPQLAASLATVAHAMPHIVRPVAQPHVFVPGPVCMHVVVAGQPPLLLAQLLIAAHTIPLPE